MKNILPISIEDEIKRSYLDYAMSVIVGRALPDVRDGLKPVHRRILYGMFEQGNLSNKPYKKSARIVGDCMGKYHPHGDAAIYDAAVRMAQDFSMRYPLIDGQGNFGSLDGDAAAAMRYTEVRLTPLAEELLKEDIDKETVDWVPNYDGSLVEPAVLPAKFPNLLANGSSGIAVGMSTNIPPHNLGELVDACLVVLQKKKYTVEDLLAVLPGPDFPTGGTINGREGIRQAYATGKGSLKVQAKAVVETHPTKEDKHSLVITELPYQVNKAQLVEVIAEHIRDKRLEGVADLRDESSREGIRVVLDLKKDASPEVVLNFLYKHTQLQATFNIQFLALAGRKPRIMTLGQLLEAFLGHRKEVIYRRTVFDLKKAREKAHILEGLKIALDHLDAVIKLIRASKTPEEARQGLMTQFKLSEIQANAILDMRLQKLTGLEREKILEEYRAIMKLIAELEAVLESEEKVKGIIARELKEIKEKYGDPRRTEITDVQPEITLEDTIPEEDMVITLSQGGYIKRTPLTLYRAQRRGGKGRIGMTTHEEDFVKQMSVGSSHDYVLIFTHQGRLYWKKVYEIPEVGSAAKGTAIVNLVQLHEGETLSAVLTVRTFDADRYLLFATRQGKVKKTPLAAYSNPRKGGIQAIVIEEGDDLIGVKPLPDQAKVLLATRMGYSIVFTGEQVRPMGRVAAGVMGIRLRKDDAVVGMVVVEDERDILTVCARGYGKKTPIAEYRLQNRGGKGIINVKVDKKNGEVVGVLEATDRDELMVISEQGKILRTPIKSISRYHRSARGVRIVDLEPEDRGSAIALLADKEDETEV
jgi:DNA gyrase subunit A